jgi:hypothetical protein
MVVSLMAFIAIAAGTPMLATGQTLRQPSPGHSSIAIGPDAITDITANRQCLSYEPDTVSVTGTLTRRMFYGAPGFGEDPTHDAKESGFYLELARPICMSNRDDEVDVPKNGVRLVQVLLDQSGYDRLRRSLGHRVTLRGILTGAINGHHHAPVLLTPVHPIHVK